MIIIILEFSVLVEMLNFTDICQEIKESNCQG